MSLVTSIYRVVNEKIVRMHSGFSNSFQYGIFRLAKEQNFICKIICLIVLNDSTSDKQKYFNGCSTPSSTLGPPKKVSGFGSQIGFKIVAVTHFLSNLLLFF